MATVKELNDKARLVGINHVALEVGSKEEALAFYAGCSSSRCVGGVRR
jgi:hypothetical protein